MTLHSSRVVRFFLNAFRGATYNLATLDLLLGYIVLPDLFDIVVKPRCQLIPYPARLFYDGIVPHGF